MCQKVIAIIGKPNVGKSTLFNRIIQSRESIENKQSGVTRDRIYGEFSWRNNQYILIDTGGIQVENASFQKEINIQANLAIDEADIILFVVDQKNGLDKDDLYISKLLKNVTKPIIICANKTDNSEDIYKYVNNWRRLAKSEIFYICATNGTNIGDLLNYLIKNHPSLKQDLALETTFSFVGKQNVGKSSLINAIFNDYKVTVSDVAGTTRDSIYLNLKYDNKFYKIIDTAGIKKASKVYDEIDQISIIKTKLAIERSKIVCQVFDGSISLSNIDLNIAKLIADSTKPMIFIVNKADLLTNEQKNLFSKTIKYELNFLHNIQVLFTSAKMQKNLSKIFVYLQNVMMECQKNWDFETLNTYLNNLELTKPPSLVSGKRIKIYEIKQLNKSSQPPIFQLLVDDARLLPNNYLKFLINKFEQYLKIQYTPLKIIMKSKLKILK